MALERLSQVGAQAALPLGQVNCPIATRGIPSKFVVDRDSTVSDRDKEVPCDVTYFGARHNWTTSAPQS